MCSKVEYFVESFTSQVEVDRVSLVCSPHQGCKAGVGRQLGAGHTASDGPQTVGSGEGGRRTGNEGVQMLLKQF